MIAFAPAALLASLLGHCAGRLDGADVATTSAQARWDQLPGRLPALKPAVLTPSLVTTSAQDPQPAESLRIRVLAATTGLPLAGATVATVAGPRSIFRLGGPGPVPVELARTDADGLAVVAVAAGPARRTTQLVIRHPGFVPALIDRRGDASAAVPGGTREVRLQPGLSVGGIVRDDAGQPVAGATVQMFDLGGVGVESDWNRLIREVGPPATDAAGRWRFDGPTVDLSRLQVTLDHPAYLALPNVRLAVGADATTTIVQRAGTVAGRVTDRAGQPIRGARIQLTYADLMQAVTAVSNDDGQYTLERCAGGDAALSVTADGFAPARRDLAVLVRPGVNPPADVPLGPGATLRVRVIDAEGHPIPGTSWRLTDWQGQALAYVGGSANAEGRFEWRGAPPDGVELRFTAPGYQDQHGVALVAGPTEQVVTLARDTVVALQVTDALTGAPVTQFAIAEAMGVADLAGVLPEHWLPGRPAVAPEGRYDWRSRRGFGDQIRLRVEADGDRIAESPLYRRDGGPQTWAVALQPEAMETGLVLGPDGAPAAGVSVVVMPAEATVILRGHQLEVSSSGSGRSAKVRVTDAEGRFRETASVAGARVIAAGKAGFAEVNGTEFRAMRTVRLVRWGRLTGDLRINGHPLPLTVVTLDRPSDSGSSLSDLFTNYNPLGLHLDAQARTDDAGRFQFDEVPPGPITVARCLAMGMLNRPLSDAEDRQRRVDVAPDATVAVVADTRGRTVTGRVVVDRSAPTIPTLPGDRPALLTARRLDHPAGAVQAESTRYAVLLAEDGSFRLDGLAPGRYEASALVYPDRQPGSRIRQAAMADLTFEVPIGPPEIPVNLGNLGAGPPPPDRPVLVDPAL